MSTPISPNPTGDRNQTSQNSDVFSDISVDIDFIIKHGSKQIISLFIPVTICMLAVVSIAKTVPYFSTTDVYLIYTPFHTPGADVGTQLWQTIANVLIFLGIIIMMTFFLVCLFKYKCYKCLNGWLIATTFMLVFVISFIFFTEVLRSTMVFFDIITFTFLLWNFGCLGVVAIHWRSPLILTQAYLIFNSVELALVFLKFLPKWTCWVLLGALAIWDLVAVLCPRGPLRMLVNLSHERQQPLLPAMIYSTTVAYFADTGTTVSRCKLVQSDSLPLDLEKEDASAFLNDLDIAPSTSGSRQGDYALASQTTGNVIEEPTAENDFSTFENAFNSTPLHPLNPLHSDASPTTSVDDHNPQLSHELMPLQNTSNQHTNSRWQELGEDILARQQTGVKLGLGDFIFYSLLIGRAAVDGDTITIITCYVAILVGMCLTIIALGVARKALPALPISIACGIVFYFSTAAVITPFISAISDRRIYF